MRRRIGKWIGTALIATAVMTFAPGEVFAAQESLNQTYDHGMPSIQNENSPAWPSIVSQAAVVMDMNTGTVVYGKNPLVEHYPASITKIMTALLALKYGHLNDTLTASSNAVNQPPDKLYMVPGEKEQLEPLLYGMLLDSANDVAVEIAEHYGGSIANFTQMMNAEAKSLGATHTHFENPNGLPNPSHQTTAYDMAVIARAAMQNTEFRKIVGTKYYNWHGDKWSSRLSNLNKMLFYYPGCIGLKTGFTSVAHETLVVAATRGSSTFLAVLMDAPTDYEIRHDASQLLDYAFGHYQTETVVRKGQVVGDLPGHNPTPLVASNDLLATVRKGDPIHYQTELSYALPAHAASKGTTVATLNVEDVTGAIVDTVPAQLTTDWTPSAVHRALRPWPVLVPLAVFFCLLTFIVRGTFKRRMRKRARRSETWISSSRLQGD
ncbi:D-alanyl-D-alanine carboxypeptidase family protein [Alicyclobacillus dauci]|uniref:serine-type D-Ala-D-Ala carboxypeptidase n=1 Tax=Alicyclobacillus dauci TaxID=1475485 RepID=A0ABY6Z1N9_9BACL|nr:D-alanyl-D-alanine carboxypeptidase family protein [Alicyclobacillus dauci]WAH36508.1 D-alanyl-D-alanine carboxypeptidase [Alicyclobacillus dauci]